MKKVRLIAITLIGLLVFSNANSQGRKIVAGFFPDWTGSSQVNSLQYNKITDVFFAFLYPDGNGNLSTTTAGSGSTILQPLSAKCKQNNVKIHASIGGANHSSNFGTIINSDAAMNNFANSVATWIQTYNLDGINIDWEFPAANQAVGLATLMQKVRAKMDGLEGTLGRQLELSIAVGPLLWNTDGINSTTIGYSDYVLVMAFDAGGGCCVCDVNHSGYNVAVNSLKKWGTSAGLSTNCGGTATGKNVPASKLVLSIPFYANSGAAYKTFSASDPAGYYNDADGNFGGNYYNSKPLIDQKVQHMMNTYPGAAGIWCWELSQDRTDQYSLLGAMYSAMQPYLGTTCNVPQPNAGADQSICGKSSITLQSNVATANGRTFEWKKNGTVISGASAATYNATTAGTYTITVKEGSSCTKSDEVIITSTAPSVNLGNDITLCASPSATLNAGISGATYVWTKNGTTIAGQTSQTLSVNQAGTYGVTVSISGCGSGSDQIVVTSNLVNAQGGSRCGAGQVTLQVTDPGTSYAWYATSTGGSPLATGASYSPNVTNTTTYYVQSNATVSSPECATASVWTASTEYTRQTSEQVITVKYNDNLYTLVSGVWWTANNQPDLFPNIWTKGSACTGTTSSCARTAVVATVNTNCGIAPNISFNNMTKTYGDASFTMNATSNSNGQITYSIQSGSGATITSNGQVTITGAGTVVVLASQAASGNYNAGTATATLQINKKSLTATADSKTKTYLASNPTLTITYTGFVNNETSSVIDTKPSITTTATKNSAAGQYPITLSGGNDNNYSLTLVNGTLSITTDSPLGINDDGQDNAITIHPNPTNGEFKLSVLLNGNEDVQVAIYDLLGNTISNKKYHGHAGKLEIESDLSIYPHGIYILKVYTNNKEKVLRIIKK